MGFVDDPGGNPCVELLQGIPSGANGEVCWAMHDVHLRVNKIPLNRKYQVRYALYPFAADETRQILERAQAYAYADEEKALFDRPSFDAQNRCDFEKGFAFAQPSVNSHFWLPMGDIRYTKWVDGEGREGSRCLKCETPAPARVMWQVESTNSVPVEAGHRYRVSVYVKTKDLRGGGAFLEAWEDGQADNVFRSRVIAWNTAWQQIEVTVEAGAHQGPAGRIAVRLVHDGIGTSWFDDCRIERSGASQIR
jgi:hypothetical protein